MIKNELFEKIRQNEKPKLASSGVQHTTKTIGMAALVFCDCLV